MTRYGYARVSTRDQHPEAQTDKLTAAGCDELFTDHGVSGSQARRPAWDKLLAVLQPGDELVTVRLDRIGRSVGNLVEVVATLRAAGVELIVLDQNIDTRTPSGKLLFHMLAAIAEFERDLIIERTRDGQATVRAMGNMRRSLGGLPPLGFRDDGPADDDTRDWVIDSPGTAEWLADAAARVLYGEPVDAVHADMPKITDAAGRPVTVKMLRAALQRPASAGLIEIDGAIIGEAGIGGPLDDETSARLRVMFASRKRGRTPNQDRYPFGKLLRCGKCGNQLTGTPGFKARGYYACRNPHKRGGVTLTPCHGVSILADDLHSLLRDYIAEWAQTDDARRIAAATAAPATAGPRADLEGQLADLTDQLADLMDKRLRMPRGSNARQRFADLAAEAEGMISDTEAKLAELDVIDAQPVVPAALDWDAMTPAERVLTVQQAAVTPIVVNAGRSGPRRAPVSDRVILDPKG